MNIIEQEDIIKGLPDDALQREARMPSGQVPQFLVVSEIQRRTDMRKRFEANQPQQNMSVADQVIQQGIGAVQPTMMSEGGRTPFTAKYNNGGMTGFLNEGVNYLQGMGNRIVGRNLPTAEEIAAASDVTFFDPAIETFKKIPQSTVNKITRDFPNLAGFSMTEIAKNLGPEVLRYYENEDYIIQQGSGQETVARMMPDGSLQQVMEPQEGLPIERGIQSLNLRGEVTNQPSGARNMISQFYNEDPFTGLVDPDNKNPLAAALLGGNVNLGTTDQKVVDVLSGLGFPENDPIQPSRRKRRMDDSPLGDFKESYVAAFGSDPNLRKGRSAGRPVQVSDVLNSLDGMTFARTSDTPTGYDTAVGLTTAQILSNARNNIENGSFDNNLDRQQSILNDLMASTKEEVDNAREQVEKQVVNEVAGEEINPNLSTIRNTNADREDAAKVDPVSIAAKQYADLLGGEKNDKMRNAMMLASLGAGIAKGDTAGGLQQAANVAASYQQKEIDRAEKGLDRAIKRADTEAMRDLKRQEVEGRIGYYDVLKLNAQNEQNRLTQTAGLKAAETDASLRQTATRTLNQGLEQALKNVPKYKTMTDAEQAAVRRKILNQTADITLRYQGSLYAPFLDQLINSMAGGTGGESRSSSYTVTEVR